MKIIIIIKGIYIAQVRNGHKCANTHKWAISQRSERREIDYKKDENREISLFLSVYANTQVE